MDFALRSDSLKSTPPIEADLLDPYKFALKHVYVAPILARRPLDIKTKVVTPGVIEVSEVKKGGLANQLDIAVGSFLLVVNGRRATGQQPDFTPDRDGLRMVLAERRKVPLNPESPNIFLVKYRAIEGFKYHMIRLNLLQCKPSAFNFVLGKAKRPCVGISADFNAVEAAGFRVGDKILMIDGVPVKDKGHCQVLLNTNPSRDMVDVVIERRAPKTPPPPSENAAEAMITDFALSSDDNVSVSSANVPTISFEDFEDWTVPEEKIVPGNPASGLPRDVPVDLARIIQPGLLPKLVGKFNPKNVGKPREPSLIVDPPQQQQQRVKLVKAVEKAVLKKPPKP